MALSPEMFLRGLRQATLEKRTGANIYSGTIVEINSIRVLKFKEEHVTDRFPANDRNRCTYSKCTGATGTIEFGMDFAALGALTDGVVADTLSTPNQKKTFTRNVNTNAPPLRLKGRTAFVDAGDPGDFVGTYPNMTITGIGWENGQDNWCIVTVDVDFAPMANGDLYILERNETAAALTTTSDVSAPTLAFSPIDGATGVSASVAPVGTFSEAIQFDANNFSLHKVTSTTNITKIAITPTIDGTKRIVTLTQDTPGLSAGDYLINVRGVRDLAGNVLAEQFFNFTVPA